MLTDAIQREMPLGGNRLNQPFFAELAKLVFRFDHAVAEGDKEIAGMQLDRLLFVAPVVEQADHGSTGFQPSRRAISAQDDRGKVAGVRVRQAPVFVVVESQKESRVLFGLRALVEMAVKEP